MTQLFIYLLSQSEQTGWDTYDSCVVAAENAKQAKMISPDSYDTVKYPKVVGKEWSGAWANSPKNVHCKKIGIAIQKKPGVICSSFNAG